MSKAAQATVIQEFHEPLSGVILRVERELEGIARLIEHNQALIARVTWSAGADDPAYVRAMQEADLVAQKIVEIARFLTAVAETVPAGLHVETRRAASDLRLAELTQSLGANSLAWAPTPATGAGDFDLF